MNKVALMGRLTRDVELGTGATVAARFSVAVNRRFKNADGNYEADFINCVAFGKSAEFVQKYFHKGDMIAITGRIQTGSYTKNDGTKVYTTDVIAEEIDFCGGKSGDATQTPTAKSSDGFMNIPDGVADDDLPFN